MDAETLRLLISVVGAAAAGIGGVFLGQHLSVEAARRERRTDDWLRRIDDTALYASMWREWAHEALSDEGAAPMRRELWSRADLTVVGDAAAVQFFAAIVTDVEHQQGRGVMSDELATRIDKGRVAILTALEHQRDAILAGKQPTILERKTVASAFESSWQRIRDRQSRTRANLESLDMPHPRDNDA